MAEVLSIKSRRNIRNKDDNENEVQGDLERYSSLVLEQLIKDNLPPTPTNFSIYFDRLLENESQNSKNAILSILEQEENSEDERSLNLEQNLKQGFGSIKNILSLSANLYKNMSLMTKILQKRKEELDSIKKDSETSSVAVSLGNDIEKLNDILKTQGVTLKELYDDTAKTIKSVENETIFDNQYGVYNKRYVMSKIAQEIELIDKFKHKSSLIMIELSKKLRSSIKNDKAIMLMTRTISRLLLKTSRRSDIVAHYGNGVFVMLLKHTDIESAKKASERLCDLISNSTFFLADREMQLDVAIGITDITKDSSAEEVVVSSMEGVERSYDSTNHFAVVLRK